MSTHAVHPPTAADRSTTLSRRAGRRRLAGGALATVVVALLGASAFVIAPAASAAQAQVGLGTATSFAVLAGSGITNTGPTTITGDVGTFPTPTETGFGSVTLSGANHGGDAVTQGAKNDLVTGYNDAAGRTPVTNVPVELGGSTLLAGVYTSPTLGLTGTLTLDAQGRNDAQFIFKAGSTLITETNSRVLLINGADPCRVVWQVGSSATFKAGTRFVGDVLAHTSITAQTRATFQGRLLARNGAVTLDTNTITRANCAPSEAGTSSTTVATTPTTVGRTGTTIGATSTASGTGTTSTAGGAGTTSTTSGAGTTGRSGTTATGGTGGSGPVQSATPALNSPGLGPIAPVAAQAVTPRPSVASPAGPSVGTGARPAARTSGSASAGASDATVKASSLAFTGLHTLGLLATGLMLLVLGATTLVAGQQGRLAGAATR